MKVHILDGNICLTLLITVFNLEELANILAYLFDKSNFIRAVTELDKEEFERYHNKSVESAVSRINAILHFGGNKIIIDGKRVLIVPINATTPNISIKNLKTIERDYIKSLSDRAIDNIENGHYDSALTQARTILEETFDYVLEKQRLCPYNGVS